MEFCSFLKEALIEVAANPTISAVGKDILFWTNMHRHNLRISGRGITTC